MPINIFFKELKSALKIKKIDFQQSFNRNIFFIHTPKEVLKVEFTYFPFEQIEKFTKKDGICIDSLADIAANKTFTIYQNPRARDFIDLYFILKKYNKFSFQQLIKMARTKFDLHIDPIQMGSQLLKTKELKDIPRMIVKIDHQQWRNFFLSQARSLSKDIFT